jgi:uncharacterized protein (TIGR02596 family)
MERRMNRRAFSLIELLVVVAIVAMLATLAAGAFSSVAQANKIRQAGETLLDGIESARQLAAVRGRTTELRILKKSGDAHYSGLQVWFASPAEPAARRITLPESVVLIDDSSLSPWLANMSAGTVSIGGAAMAYRAFKVRPSGAIEPAPSDPNSLYLTVAAAQSPTGSTPANFATVQVNPNTARPLLYRP